MLCAGISVIFASAGETVAVVVDAGDVKGLASLGATLDMSTHSSPSVISYQNMHGRGIVIEF